MTDCAGRRCAGLYRYTSESDLELKKSMAEFTVMNSLIAVRMSAYLGVKRSHVAAVADGELSGAVVHVGHFVPPIVLLGVWVGSARVRLRWVRVVVVTPGTKTR